jgi:alkaline phosphatase D
MQNITQAKLQDVVTLGGDVHMNVAANLRVQPNQEKSPVVASEFISTSITSRGLDESVLSTIRANNADLLHARSDERGFALIEVSPSGVQCEFRTTPFPANAKASLSVQATYVVKSGVAGPQKA